MVANQLAMDAPGWAHTFAKQASGTYNNQWMVLDVRKAQKAVASAGELLDDTFWLGLGLELGLGLGLAKPKPLLTLSLA